MQQRSEGTRAKIMEAAIKLFSIQGYNKASVDDICEEAGISKGAFYHHFKSKQALFLALLDGWLQFVDNAIETREASARLPMQEACAPTSEGDFPVPPVRRKRASRPILRLAPPLC